MPEGALILDSGSCAPERRGIQSLSVFTEGQSAAGLNGVRGLGRAMKFPSGSDGRPAGVFESVLGFQYDVHQPKGLIVGSVSVNGVRLHYEDTGQGTENVVFSHSFLLSGEHFAPQIKKLSRHYRCLAFDHRGHGASEAPDSGYDMENLYADAVSFIEAVGCSPCHFVGLSTGGFIGLRIGIRRPELLRSLVLMDTSADSHESDRLYKIRRARRSSSQGDIKAGARG